MSSEQPSGFVIPKRDDCVCTRNYCEENIWHLVKRVMDTNKATPNLKCYVVIMSNADRCVYLWRQESVTANDGLLFWDYHAFLITELQEQQTLVFDLNSTLPFPVPFSHYTKEALRHDFTAERYFKIIPGETYIEQFSSDREHMVQGDGWLSLPPSYPPILNEAGESNLDDIICMDASDDFGEVLNLDQFNARFTRPTRPSE